MRGFNLDPDKNVSYQLSLALDYLALNKFQRSWIVNMYSYTVYKGPLSVKQTEVTNKILSKVRVYESCIDFPCCGHSKCGTHTMARIELMLNAGLTPIE